MGGKASGPLNVPLVLPSITKVPLELYEKVCIIIIRFWDKLQMYGIWVTTGLAF